ncbi:FAD dependent oxidoreductase [Polychaeton citri CBS 116435]|uniref:FAD dependent oxidoreductase n=1 Tax=Polychaeton citri CBS 116435 TaxID=1314669 RepID=A0A9P4UNB2_9PEZI|nr:FAD dependent oxidoreductase [Polychaeton citri CBS 116435]
MTYESSVLIIGGGIFGTSTAYHLSKLYHDPSKITVLDPAPSPSSEDPKGRQAASTDINKIIRADYSSPFYCELAYEALSAWADWPELEPYYHRTGWVMLEETGSDLASRIRKVFQNRSHDPTEDVSLQGDLENRWGGILKGTVTDGFGNAYWNPEAGWCEAAAATASLMQAAIERGVKYEVGQADEIMMDGSVCQGARTKDGREVVADKIIIASGSWTSALLSPLEDALEIPEEERVEKQAQAAGVAVVHYELSEIELEQLKDMPVVVYGAHGEVIPPPHANRLLKYTNANTFTNPTITKSGHRISIPPETSQHEVPEELKQEMYDVMTSKAMPTFVQHKTPSYWRLCWDSFTPTQDWLLTKHPHPNLSNLYLAIGGSFHSYKFLPIAGKYMANVVTDQSNGVQKDCAWGWKHWDPSQELKGAHEATKPKRELASLYDNA